MTERLHTTDQLELAQLALRNYELGETSLHFIGHSENITFRIENSEGSSFLLRLKSPVTGVTDETWLSVESLESEMMWLVALAEHPDIRVQQPVRNRDGTYVTAIEAGTDGKVIPCTVLKWIKGNHVTDITSELAGKLGKTVARLHEQSTNWSPPPEFQRPRWDWELIYQTTMTRSRKGVEIGTISRQHLEAIDDVLKKVRPDVESMGYGEERWGLIHSDLHPDNYLVNEGEICPIDFSACCFGHYLADFAETLRFLKPEWHSAFLEGYMGVRQKPYESLKDLEVFWVIGKVSNLSFLALNPIDYDHLSRTARLTPEKIEDCVVKYLNGEHFLELS
jgi:Ser/Thr protein kinase RdoA (MazF antagonist)